MIQSRFLITAALAFTTAAGALAQGAAQPTLVATFEAWTMWTYTGSLASNAEGKVCYIYSEPEKMEPTRLDHGRVSFSITHSPSQGIQNEANFIAGYALKEQSSVTVQIGDRTFTMFTQGDSAWLVDKTDEPELLAAMKAGSTMTVKAVSRRGNNTTYNYSLKGVTAAADKMITECQ
jgi:invasion protein IalB